MTINTTYSGILNIDKPKGPTSHDVIDFVRKTASMKKIGHAGTLDPMATGVLLVLLGQSTRLMEYSHGLSKTYRGTIILGAVSDTDDAFGNIVSRNNALPPQENSIAQVLTLFTGNISQIPPSYAAIKVKGKKLYEYARQNQNVAKKPRPVTIYNIELIDYKYPDLTIRIKCQSGTYIRALARDIGESLNTGGYLSELRREAIGDFKVEDALPLKKLTPQNLPNQLIPPQKLISRFVKVVLSWDEISRLKQGLPLKYNKKPLPDGQPLALFGEDDTLIGIGYYDPIKLLLYPKKIL